MDIVRKELESKNGDFTHEQVIITCHSQSELDAVLYCSENADAQVEISTGSNISTEVRANIGYFLNLLCNVLTLRGGK
jgi:hypothetical protein